MKHIYYLLLASCVFAMCSLAEPNPRPCPIPDLERAPSTPPPFVQTIKARAAEARSNQVACTAERAAYMQLLSKLASAQGISTNAIADAKPASVLLRATILLRAAKELQAKSAP